MGGDVRPVMRRVEGSWHFYADHPEGYAAIAAAAVSTAIAIPSAANPDRTPNASPASAPGLGLARDEGAANGVGRVRDENAAPEDGRPTLKTEEEK